MFHKDDTSGWTQSGKHNKRTKNLILVGGFACVILGSAWGLFFLSRGSLPLFSINTLTVIAGVVLIVLASRNQLRAAAIIMSHTLLLTVTLASLGDVPVEGIQRSVHMNLWPVAAATFLIFYREGPYLRLVLPIATLLIFLAFALNLVPLPWPELVAPAEGRSAGVWINNITGVVSTCIVIAMMQSTMNARRTLESDMRQAIARGGFTIHYQPQVDPSGNIFGAEALLRWQHPARGNIPPQEFIPLAEEIGLIIPIGDWVLRTACAQLVDWAKAPQTNRLTIAVNVSASQFRQPDFVQHIKNIVMLSGAEPSRLKLELTESALAEDIEAVVIKMQALKDLGISWSIDDFGTGYSSLSSLKNLPLDQLKIDKSFVNDLLTDARSTAIVETVIQLSRSLNLALIAEGVETREQLAALQAAGCPSYQGYLFSPPIPITALDDLIAASPRSAKRQSGSSV